MTSVLLNRSEIAALIPHAGSMCLLEQVLSYSDAQIVCRTQSHLSPSNPLKVEGQLSKMHLIEYGAQAIAIHGGLLEAAAEEAVQKESESKGCRPITRSPRARRPNAGFIATVKSVQWGRFEPCTEFLEITAVAIATSEQSKVYEVTVCDAGLKRICSARVMIVHPEWEKD